METTLGGGGGEASIHLSALITGNRTTSWIIERDQCEGLDHLIIANKDNGHPVYGFLKCRKSGQQDEIEGDNVSRPVHKFSTLSENPNINLNI